MRPYYIIHDELYKRRKLEGQSGWATEEQLEENLARLQRTLEADYVPGSGKMLELGCGAGNLTLWLAARGYEAYGVDIAPTAIGWARENAASAGVTAEFRVGSVLDLEDYADDFFDFVLDGNCFHCIIGEDRRLFLAAASRVLKPGGFFHVRTMCGDVTKEQIQGYDPQSRCVFTDDGIPVRYLGLAEEILDEIGTAGFQIINSEVKTTSDDDDPDDLLVDATKP